MPRPVTVICSFLVLLPLLATAQSLRHQADRQFDLLAYARAVDLYEQALNHSVLSDPERQTMLVKLAYSYRQIRDSQNAERVYRMLINPATPLQGDDTKCYLYYAQVLASNGKYKEAQDVYEIYHHSQPEDQRGKPFSALYQDVSILTRNAGSYKVEFLNINTDKAEFSPMYYKSGLVFVTNKGRRGTLKRVFTWDNSPFLDLYYLPDAPDLSETVASLGGAAGTPPKVRIRTNASLGKDYYTHPTANDARTVGYGSAAAAPASSVALPAGAETKPFGRALNTKYHEGPVAFTKEGKRVFFTRNNYNHGRYRQSADGVNKIKLYTAESQNDQWGAVQELPFNSDDYSTGHPALSPDDRLLYFASDRPGGFGGVDLYVSRLEGDKWSEPVNLGPQINTKGNEMFPFMDDRGNLYFSSDGHPGLGDLDIFYVQLTGGGAVKQVQNLGEPINSSKDDFGIITDGSRLTGYFSSNRLRGGSDDDIYRFRREGPLYPCRELTVNVFDNQTRQPIRNALINIESREGTAEKRQMQTDPEGNIRLCLDPDSEFRFMASTAGYGSSQLGFSTKNLADGQPLRLELPLNRTQRVRSKVRGKILTHTGRQPIDAVTVVLHSECDSAAYEVVTGRDGSYEFWVEPGCNYTLEALKDCMGTTGGSVSVTSGSTSAPGETTTELTMFQAGDIVRIDNIYYDLNQWTIRPDAAAELDKLVRLMEKYPKMQIELRSHTDSRASVSYNKQLSTRRANAVVAYLRKRGLDANRMWATGYGESVLLNGCQDGVPCTEAEHQQNRRTEIKILQIE